MAFRVEIGEDVESAIGLNITGAAVEVRFHGGAQAPVYDSENGGALVTQPLTTVNGKIGPDYPNGAWVAAGDYDLLVTFGGDTLTYFWSAVRGDQFVTALPAGAGTSAPEEGEKAIELYDAVNGGAWLRRYRAAATQWDMVGGPPPAAASLPGAPRTRQEIYLTGGSPAVQHLRYNGATWDYVGTPPFVPVPGSPLDVLDVGQSGQIRAGRALANTDWALLGLNPPLGGWNLSDLTDYSGNGRTLTNKNGITFTTGIMGEASSAALFTTDLTKALYIPGDGAAADLALRIRTGSWGCWFKCGRRGTAQYLISRVGTAGTAAVWQYAVRVGSGNTLTADISDGATFSTVTGLSDVVDNRWHHVVVTHDGSILRIYVDAVPEVSVAAPRLIQATNLPFNIGSFAADSGTAPVSPFTGPIDEAFVTGDILSPEQVRLLYAAKVPHGYATTPTRASMGVRRYRRGGPYDTTDFPAQPARLYNFTGGVLTDQGTNGQALTNNNAAVVVAGVDGTRDGAFHFDAASTRNLSATDAGLPSALAQRTYGCWAKIYGTLGVDGNIMGWGTASTADARIAVAVGTNALKFTSGADIATGGPPINDGLWHHIVVVEDNGAIDTIKRRLYLDGKYLIGSTVMNTLTLLSPGAATGFRIGANPAGAIPINGDIDGAFVAAVAYTPEQVAKLYQKGGQSLARSPYPEGDSIELMDATSLYMINDAIDSQNKIDLAVSA